MGEVAYNVILAIMVIVIGILTYIFMHYYITANGCYSDVNLWCYNDWQCKTGDTTFSNPASNVDNITSICAIEAAKDEIGTDCICQETLFNYNFTSTDPVTGQKSTQTNSTNPCTNSS